MSVRFEERCCCSSLSSNLNSRSPFLTRSPISTGSTSILPLISGRTETCSDGPISPAALTAKLMSRNSTVAVVGRSGEAAATLPFCQWFQAEYPPKPAPSSATNKNHFFIVIERTYSLNVRNVPGQFIVDGRERRKRCSRREVHFSWQSFNIS